MARQAGHKFFVKGEKGAGKTTFALSFAEYAQEVGGRVKFYDIDGHGNFVLDSNNGWKNVVDRVPVGSLNSLAEDLNRHNPDKWPVVIVDSVSPLESLAIRYSDRLAAKGGQRGEKPSLDLLAIAKAQPTREQRAATKRLQYAVWDALNDLETDFTILTAWIVYLSKKGTKYERAIPHTQFHCDGVFKVYKSMELAGYIGPGGRHQYFLDVEDIKSGQSGIKIQNPSYERLAATYTNLSAQVIKTRKLNATL